MVSIGKRRANQMRRVAVYLTPDELTWVRSAALGNRTSVSAFVAGIVIEAWEAELGMLREMDEDEAQGRTGS
jgi:hypothetical protein